MKLKRFVAKDMREALLMIRDELGPDAIIMSNKRMADGVEIVAGVDDTKANKPKPAIKDEQALRSLVNDKEGLERFLAMQKQARNAKKQNIFENNVKTLEDDSVSISLKGTRAMESETYAPPQARGIVKKTNPTTNIVANVESNKEALFGTGSSYASSLTEILDRQASLQQAQNLNKVSTVNLNMYEEEEEEPQLQMPMHLHSQITKDDNNISLNQQKILKSQNNDEQDEAPKPLSESQELQSLFSKSKVKIAKEEHEKTNGIETFDVNDSNSNKDIQSLSEEVLAIRKLLQFELSGLFSETKAREEPVRAMVEKLLVSAGFDQEISSTLVKEISVDASFNFAWRELSSILESHIKVSDDEIIKKGGIVALIGPAGVGKTTTLAKLAARFVMKYGPEKVAIVSADHYRIGAFEQIKTYGRIMGCSALSVKSITDLPEIMYTLKDKSLVLVDTAGVGLKDERFGTQLAQLKMQSSLNIKHYLVLPATAHRRVLTQAYNHFKDIGLNGLVLTKIDESFGLGDALSLSIKENLPLSYITDGQRVPEDLSVPDAHMLTIKALSCVEDDVAREVLKTQ